MVLSISLFFEGKKREAKQLSWKVTFKKKTTRPPPPPTQQTNNQQKPNPSQTPQNREETHTDPVLAIHMYLLLERIDAQFARHIIDIHKHPV